jgi:hypothetical protein
VRKLFFFLVLVLSLATPLLAQTLAIPRQAQTATEEFLPAGTLLTCTMSEPNFSSKTVEVGDPVLCHLGQVSSFGHPVFPRGAYMTGHLQDSKAPGHLWGKGWLEVDFDRIILPGPEMLPLSAKLISTPNYKVDREGKVHGHGHAVRDTVEWMIPPLWPIKAILLPARGPYVKFKGETRLTMRLMEDVEFPSFARNVPMPPWSSDRNTTGSLQTPHIWRNDLQPVASRNYHSQPTQLQMQPAAFVSRSAPDTSPTVTSQSTLLVLKDSSSYLAQSYWIENEHLHCVTQGAPEIDIPLDKIDLAETVRLNHERNTEFALNSRPQTNNTEIAQQTNTQIAQH